MNLKTFGAAAAFAALLATSAGSAGAATYTAVAPITAGTATAFKAPASQPLELVQYRHGYGPRGYGGYAPRGGGWGFRPWARRPYFGTIVAGVALGTIIAVTAYGVAPPRPRPDMCWFWTDPSQSRGYWDYC